MGLLKGYPKIPHQSIFKKKPAVKAYGRIQNQNDGTATKGS